MFDQLSSSRRRISPAKRILIPVLSFAVIIAAGALLHSSPAPNRQQQWLTRYGPTFKHQLRTIDTDFLSILTVARVARTTTSFTHLGGDCTHLGRYLDSTDLVTAIPAQPLARDAGAYFAQLKSMTPACESLAHTFLHTDPVTKDFSNEFNSFLGRLKRSQRTAAAIEVDVTDLTQHDQ